MIANSTTMDISIIWISNFNKVCKQLFQDYNSLQVFYFNNKSD